MQNDEILDYFNRTSESNREYLNFGYEKPPAK